LRGDRQQRVQAIDRASARKTIGVYRIHHQIVAPISAAGLEHADRNLFDDHRDAGVQEIELHALRDAARFVIAFSHQ
jgi:hypothetical protein